MLQQIIVALGQQRRIDRTDGGAANGVKGKPLFQAGLVYTDMVRPAAAAAFQCQTTHSITPFYYPTIDPIGL